jgi:hypothetical protein
LAAIHARQLVKRIFAGVDAEVEQACLRVWAEREPQAAVAADLGMSRFALARKMAAVKMRSVQFQAWV